MHQYSIDENPSEKEAVPNLTVRGYELINEIKKVLENECSSTVSCADIITLAPRDAVFLAGGPNYTVPTGRRDGRRSNINYVDLPGPELNVPEAFQFFQAKGLTSNEMVTLLGAHTDPNRNCSLVPKLSRICGAASSNNPNATAFLDQSTNFVFDNKFYSEILSHRGILHIGQDLALNKTTFPMVFKFPSNSVEFGQSFEDAMIKLGSIQVLVGNAGEIRKNCSVSNRVKPQQPINQSNKTKPIDKGNKPKPINQGNKLKPIHQGNKWKPIDRGKKPRPVNKGKKLNPIKQNGKQKANRKTLKPIKLGKKD